MTPVSPSLASTGTDQELATPVAAASPVNGDHPACASVTMTGLPVAAAWPAGPPPTPNGSVAHCVSSSSGRPSDAVHASSAPAARWMQSRSDPRAAPSADKISDRLDEGSAATRRPVRPCSLVSWRRADESSLLAGQQRGDVVGAEQSEDSTSAATRPCRSTTIRSASRNIRSRSWQAITMVVDLSRSAAISSSTCAA